jgi:type II secretory pathway component GspD/PulD (secretin)
MNGYIPLEIMATVSALAGNQVIQGVEVPIVNERMIDARVALKDTYTVAIGGMIKDDWITSRNSVPYLGDMPYFGKSLFGWNKKEKIKNNLVIFITATVVKPDESNERWDRQLREMHMESDGEFQDVITNYPSWHQLALSEEEIKEREQALIMDASTNSFVSANKVRSLND